MSALPEAPHPVAHLRADGVSLVVLLDPDAPRIVHFGRALSDADAAGAAASDLPAVTFSSLDSPRMLPLLAVEDDGWSGAPALEWHRAGAHAAPLPRLTEVLESSGSALHLRWLDARAGVQVETEHRLRPWGVLEAALTVTSASGGDAAPLDLVAARTLLPLPARAAEIVDFTGRWTDERVPQRTPVRDGAHVRAGRRGRPGHDAAYATLVGTAGFRFGDGELWAAHVAWSGDTEVQVQRLPEGAGVSGAVLAAGELLRAGEVRLAAGESYRSPTAYLTWSDAGIDGVSARWHRAARALPGHPSRPRPLVLNTWEAVYFDQDPERIGELARAAADIGVERFVLDDGWFVGRDHDRAALGDWFVDAGKWPDGLRPLSDLVHGLGMEFGLWFEPEMVNPDSRLAREHPEWLLAARPDARTWRHQLALDLTQPGARAYMAERLDAAVRDFGLDFIKWDHNRDLHAAVSPATGRVRVHAQTEAFYGLVDELRARHPSLEIESCASGGARIDFGVLARTQRVWASDSNDPIDRQRIQRWTGVLVPPEVSGSHVGPPVAHTTARASSLGFRLTTALFGHAGIEWDITRCSDEERAALRTWAGVYRDLRGLLHGGRVVRGDESDPETLLHGVVSDSGDHAVFAWVRLGTSAVAGTPRTPFPGLDRAARYAVRERTELGGGVRHEVADPAWLRSGTPFLASGALLADVGLPLPLLAPGSAMLLELRRIG